jgi:hypothetical protein
MGEQQRESVRGQRSKGQNARPAHQRRRHQARGGENHQPLVLVPVVAPEHSAEEEDFNTHACFEQLTLCG